MQLLAWAWAAYIASISVVYLAAIGLRLSFCVAVSSSPPRDHSAGRIVVTLDLLARESLESAASTPALIAAINAGSRESSVLERALAPPNRSPNPNRGRFSARFPSTKSQMNQDPLSGRPSHLAGPVLASPYCCSGSSAGQSGSPCLGSAAATKEK